MSTELFSLICQECSEHFEAERETAKFCNDKCRLKNWRTKEKAKKGAIRSTCPNCFQEFYHKNPKKEYCNPKCKTAYHRRIEEQRKNYDEQFRLHTYFAPPTPEEQINAMLQKAWREQQLEDI
jgi:hypothetical protein